MSFIPLVIHTDSPSVLLAFPLIQSAAVFHHLLAAFFRVSHSGSLTTYTVFCAFLHPPHACISLLFSLSLFLQHPPPHILFIPPPRMTPVPLRPLNRLSLRLEMSFSNISQSGLVPCELVVCLFNWRRAASERVLYVRNGVVQGEERD